MSPLVPRRSFLAGIAGVLFCIAVCITVLNLVWTYQGEGYDGDSDSDNLYYSWLEDVGDIDGDGVSEVLAAQDSAYRGTDRNHIAVRSGADGTELLRMESPPGRLYGTYAAGGAGDVDGDGVPDLLVSVLDVGEEWSHDRVGFALFSGRTHSILELAGDKNDVDVASVPSQPPGLFKIRVIEDVYSYELVSWKGELVATGTLEHPGVLESIRIRGGTYRDEGPLACLSYYNWVHLGVRWGTGSVGPDGLPEKAMWKELGVLPRGSVVEAGEDLDGDGARDVLASCTEAGRNSLRGYKWPTGEPIMDIPLAHLGLVSACGAVHSSDLDSTGTKLLVVLGRNSKTRGYFGSALVVYSHGERRVRMSKQYDWRTGQICVPGDVDGDGLDDIVVMGQRMEQPRDILACVSGADGGVLWLTIQED